MPMAAAVYRAHSNSGSSGHTNGQKTSDAVIDDNQIVVTNGASLMPRRSFSSPLISLEDMMANMAALDRAAAQRQGQVTVAAEGWRQAL
jgi:hypothetical protein